MTLLGRRRDAWRQAQRRDWTLERLGGADDDEDEADAVAPLVIIRSQMDAGARGGEICTAVAYALAVAFLADGERALDPPRVSRALRACNAFFETRAVAGPLMLAEMQAWFPPPPQVLVGEVAGLIRLEQCVRLDPSESLRVMPLAALLDGMRQRPARAHRMALVVTYGGHTRLVHSAAAGRFGVLDPLYGAAADLVLPLAGAAEYAGLLMSRAY